MSSATNVAQDSSRAVENEPQWTDFRVDPLPRSNSGGRADVAISSTWFRCALRYAAMPRGSAQSSPTHDTGRDFAEALGFSQPPAFQSPTKTERVKLLMNYCKGSLNVTDVKELLE